MNEVRKRRVALLKQGGDAISGSPRDAESLHLANRSRPGKQRSDEKRLQ
jgi:hypothetical protein